MRKVVQKTAQDGDRLEQLTGTNKTTIKQLRTEVSDEKTLRTRV